MLYPNWSVKTRCAALGVDIATVKRTIDVFNQLFKQNIMRQAVFLPSISGKRLIPCQTISLASFRAFGSSADFLTWVPVLTKATATGINHAGWVLEPLLCYVASGRGFGWPKGWKIKIINLALDTILFLKNRQTMNNSFTILK